MKDEDTPEVTLTVLGMLILMPVLVLAVVKFWILSYQFFFGP